MKRRKITLEVISKAVLCFCFGFLTTYFSFTLIARPIETFTYAEENSIPLPSEPELYPRTYSDLPNIETKTEQRLPLAQRSVFASLYTSARFYYPNKTNSTNSNEEAETETNSEEENNTETKDSSEAIEI